MGALLWVSLSCLSPSNIPLNDLSTISAAFFSSPRLSGFDRLMAILCQAQSIREVIAFPKTSVGTDLLFKSPAPVNEEVLYQYGLQPRSTTR